MVDSSNRIFLQHFHNQILTEFANRSGKLQFLSGKGLLYFLDAAGSIRGPSINQFVQKNSETPYVYLLGVLSFENHFRSHVLKRTAKSCFYLSVAFGGPSEIAEFHSEILINQNILWFDISVVYFVLVQIIQRQKNLIKYFQSQGLRESLGTHVVEKAPIESVLQNHEHLVLFFDDLQTLNDM